MAASWRAVGRRRLIVAACVSLAVVLLLGLLGLGPSPAVAVRAPLVGPIAVSGSTLVDQGAGGRAVTLQGVNIAATGPGPYSGGFVDPMAVSTLVGWGATFVRLEISTDQVMQACSGEVYDPTYRSELAQAVQALTSQGILTVLDIHDSNPNCLWPTAQNSGAVPLPGEDTAQVLASLANEFGSNPLVAYEPFNEPEGCAKADTGLGASQFVSYLSEPTGACPTETESNIAWSNQGTVSVGGIKVLGQTVAPKTYQAPGMDSLYQTIMNNRPAGAPAPLVFLDANGWSAATETFDAMGTPLSSASNVVLVFHPYDCQDTSSAASDGHQSAVCRDSTPESCSTVSQRVGWSMTDPATGGRWSRPVVFDEFNFPAGEDSYYTTGGGGLLGGKTPILLYQHGYWVNNMIATMQRNGTAGWSVFYFQNADVSDYQTPYGMVSPGVGPSTPTPWPANTNAAPAVNAMQGASLSCEAPPLGFG